MKVKSIAPWFGGKTNLAPTIVEELGAHSAYFEPFCGSMAVLLAKPESSSETVNDLHGDLTNLARVVRHPVQGPMLYRRLRRTLRCEQLHRWASTEISMKQYLEPPDRSYEHVVSRAYDYFLVSWMGRCGTSGTLAKASTFPVRNTPGGGANGKRFVAAVDSIPAWRRRMRCVTITCRDGFTMLEKISDDPKVAIYVDPPYLKKGTKYLHDFEDGDHVRLAKLLHRFQKARVVVSYYDDEALDALYPGWTKRVIEMTKASGNQGKRGKSESRAKEVLLKNIATNGS